MQILITNYFKLQTEITTNLFHWHAKLCQTDKYRDIRFIFG